MSEQQSTEVPATGDNKEGNKIAAEKDSNFVSKEEIGNY